MRRHLRALGFILALGWAGAAPAQQIDTYGCNNWQSEPDRAIRACTRAIRMFEAHGSAYQVSRADNLAWAYFSMGSAYGQKGEHDKAIELLTLSIRNRPGAGAYTNRGVAYLHTGDGPAALSDLREAARLEPSSEQAYRNLTALEAQLRGAPGRTSLPPRGVLSGLVADCNGRSSGSFEQMLPACDAALALPSISATQKASVLASRGRIYSYRDRLADAAGDLAEAVRLDPGRPSYRATYGDILRKQGRTAEAAAAYRAALALDGDFAPALGGLDRLGVAPAAGEPDDLVRRTQLALQRLGYAVGAADGRAGPRTAAAVREFQRRAGLPEDGLVSAPLVEAVESEAR